MSTSQSTVKGIFNEAAGKVKQAAGEAFNNDKLANEGAAQQVKGHTQQAWGSVKEAVHDSAQNVRERNQPPAERDAHDIREKVTSTAQNVKQSIKAGVDNFRKHNKDAA